MAPFDSHAVAPPGVAEPTGPIRVVFADDHGRYRVGLANAIAGHRRLELAEAVSDGELALDAVGRHDPDVVLLDVRMPGLDGLETARRLTDGRATVVLLTGSASLPLADQAEAAGVRAVLTKDLSRREICSRLVDLAA
jgi:DNA-binding NarL/FixJ family response regulator